MFIDGTYNCFYLLSGYLEFKYLLFVCGLAFIFFIYQFQKLLTNKLYLLGIILFLGGSSYNSYFRLNGECVLDNLNFFNMFAFNVADVLVLIGLLIICVVVYYYSHGTTN